MEHSVRITNSPSPILEIEGQSASVKSKTKSADGSNKITDRETSPLRQEVTFSPFLTIDDELYSEILTPLTSRAVESQASSFSEILSLCNEFINDAGEGTSSDLNQSAMMPSEKLLEPFINAPLSVPIIKTPLSMIFTCDEIGTIKRGLVNKLESTDVPIYKSASFMSKLLQFQAERGIESGITKHSLNSIFLKMKKELIASGDYIEPLENPSQHLTASSEHVNPPVCLTENLTSSKVSSDSSEQEQSPKTIYHCNIKDCKMVFNCSDKLEVHQRKIHLGINPYVCGYCHKDFKTADSRNDHIKVMHETERLNIHCSLCSKSFLSTKKLESHMLVHTGEKPFKCSLCNFAGTQIGILNKHIKRKHPESTEKLIIKAPPRQKTNFNCTFCNKSFSRKGLLNNHLRIHTNETPFKCPYCNYASNQKPNLRRHIERHHSGMVDKKQ